MNRKNFRVLPTLRSICSSKGTTRHCQREINNRLERLGGELNAFTTKEETVVHSTTLKEDIGKSADLLFEIVLSSTFPEKSSSKSAQ